MNTQTHPLLAITMGDPAGIGPEIIVKTLSSDKIYDKCSPLVLGDASVMEHAVSHITKLNTAVQVIAESEIRTFNYQPGSIAVLDFANVVLGRLVHGTVSSMSGKASFEYIQKAIELALAAKVDATVTAPIHKEAIRAAGYHYAGHTEIYADLTKTRDYAMMLVHGTFRVIHVSTHVSLREAVDRVKKERILAVIRLADGTLKQMGMECPRIAVAGLNPHASDGGLFGREEAEEILPAVDSARTDGIHAEGPIPPDTCFSKTRGGQYDIAVAMYHDQGHIPLKVVGFIWDEASQRWSSVSGINVTLGLPIIRTSVDHGVAFGKAGKGTASEDSMKAAVELAAMLSVGRK